MLARKVVRRMSEAFQDAPLPAGSFPGSGLAPTTSILARVGAERHFDLGHALQWAAKARRISTARLAFDIMRRQMGRQKLTAANYFHYGLHLGKFTNADRAQFIGDAATTVLNKAITAPDVVAIWRNKITTALALEAAGLPTPPIRAVFQLTGQPSPYRTLSSIKTLTEYMSISASFPFFGKPIDGSEGRGAISIVARDGADKVVLGDGRKVFAAQLAQEIADTYPHGYMFQDKLRQHPDLAALAGPVICSLRVFSVWVGGRFTPLYSNMRLPAPGAMTDITQTSSAAIDLKDGRIRRTQDSRRLGGHSLDHSQVTGAALIGAQLPDWAQVMALSQAAHALFPAQGVLGIDIALTEDGPTIVELNSNPLHGGYHQTTDEGLLNPAFRKVFVAALAERGIARRQRGMLVP